MQTQPRSASTSFIKDPSVILTAILILLPIAFEVNSPNLIGTILGYLLSVPCLICVTLMLILELRAPTGLHITLSEYRVSRWYLVNGLGYHLLFDTVSGLMQGWSLMTKQYNYLDHRFGAPFEIGSEVATLAVWLEAAVMCPGCILIFIGYRYILPKQRKSENINSSPSSIVWIYCLELVIGLCQCVGSYFFYGAEIILLVTGQNTHIPYARNIKNLDFDLWECFYFWFGTIFMAAVWIVIPLICMVRAYRQLVILVKDSKVKLD